MPTLVGAFIEEQRRLAGLSRSQLAALIGCQNVSKGAGRIADLERHGERQPDLLPRIVAALHLNAGHALTLFEEDQRRARDAWERWAGEPVEPVLRFRPFAALWCTEPIPVGLTRDEAVA